MLACSIVLAPANNALAAENAPLSTISPDGRNEIRLYSSPLSYEVVRDGTTLVSRTPIAMQIDGKSLGGDCLPKSVTTRKEPSACASEPSPIYKKGALNLTACEKFADFGDWGIALVARNDGVAYRFETKMPGIIRVEAETAGVAFPDSDAKAWVNFTTKEGLEETVPVALRAKEIVTDGVTCTANKTKRNLVYLPLVYSTNGKTLAVTESDVIDYPVWYLKRPPEKQNEPLCGFFAKYPAKTAHVSNDNNWKRFDVETGGRWVEIKEEAPWLVETSGTRTFPWRVFILADAPAKLCEADIVNALAKPAEKDHDFSWVKPGKVAWDWWNDFDNMGTQAGCTTEGYKRFIDFAAANNVEYVILDEGWSEKLNIWKDSPRVDLKGVIDYAASKNVGIILWMAWAHAYGDEEHVAEHFSKLGAKGFKVDFMDRGDAECQRFLWKFAEACRKNKMLVDYHGANRPTGMSRAYPNILNYEGIHGLEQMKWFKNGYDMMSNDVLAFYLRMTAGPLDYTPGAMDNYAVGKYAGTYRNPGSVGTRCRQMAMIALYEAPLQMLADAPTKYENNIECFRFMASTPVIWDDTIGLDGTPDTFAALARKAKDGSWYVAAINNAEERTWTLDTAFLGNAGKEWKAEIFRDAPDAAVSPTHYVHETGTVTAGKKASIWMAPGGGTIIHLMPSL